MTGNNIPEIILQETKHLPDDLLKEVLDFILFLKTKSHSSTTVTYFLCFNVFFLLCFLLRV